MITDSDVKKLKKTFATKADLKKTEKSIRIELDSKLKRTENSIRLDFKSELDTKLKKTEKVLRSEFKNDFKKFETNIVNEIVSVIEALGTKIQESLSKIKDHGDVLENHERRLDKLEDSAFN